MPTIYLAGPSVFAPDSARIGRELLGLCELHGLRGIYPTDDIPPGATDPKAIYRACTDAIGRSDGVIADIAPFRGFHMDPGTAFEIGYAVARSKPVWLYGSPQAMIARVWAEKTAAGWRDAKGMLVEDFGFPENLMVTVPAAGIFDLAEQAIIAAAKALKAAP